MQRNTGYFPTESLEPSGNRLFSRSALNEGYLFRGSLDKSFRTGIVEYHFDAEGIETISQMGYSKNYWTAFKEYGTMGQYIYVKRKDNKMVLIDKNDLSTGELEELTQLLLNNVKM